MIEAIEFKNFKALRDATLPLSQFTLIVGPNGSGKSTALLAPFALQNPGGWYFDQIRSVGTSDNSSIIRLKWTELWNDARNDFNISVQWRAGQIPDFRLEPQGPGRPSNPDRPRNALQRARWFSLDANQIAQAVQLRPNMRLEANGLGLAGVLDRMRDQHPERFEALNEQLGQWVPEFDRVLFDTPREGHRSLALRSRNGSHLISAGDLSHGTLLALALLALAYLPDPPSIVCLEEPDRGLHPRLLRDVRDALYRLAYPEGAHEKREPVQVIATTHNPYFLDLFREHPEEIVIAEKVGLEGKFSRLSDRSDLEEILGDAPLSEVWYSGVLGGVPAGT